MKLVLHNGNALRNEAGDPVCLDTRKTLLLLAILAEHQGQTLSRRTVAQTVWPNVSERAARDSMRTALTAIRKALPGEALHAEPDRILLRNGSVTIQTSFLDGEFMPDFDDDWVVERRLDDRAKAVNRLLHDARIEADRDNLQAALASVERACARDPFCDRAAALRIEVLERLGKLSQAAETSQAHRRRVLRDLGTVSQVTPAPTDCASPLRQTAEWLLDRDPGEALAFLHSTGPHWEIAPVAGSLELHKRALRQTDEASPHWKAVRAQMLYIRWCLNGIADNVAPAEEAHQIACADRDAETAFKLAVVLAYCYLSRGQFSRALGMAVDLRKVAKSGLSTDSIDTAELTLSIVHAHAGDSKLGQRMMRRIGLQAEDASSLLVAGQRYLMAAQTALDDGNLAECDAKIQKAKGAYQSNAGDRMLGFAGIMEAELLDASGDPLRAREELSIVLAKGAGVIGHSAMAMASDLMAAIDCRLGEFDLSAESLALSKAFRDSLGTVASPMERRRLAPVKRTLVEKLGQEYLRRLISRPRLAVT